MKKREVTPGLHPLVELNHLWPEEKELVQKYLGSEFYVTNGGGTIKLGNSEYNYILMKFTNEYQEQFNIEREIIVVFSSYAFFEPRTLDAFDEAHQRHQELRIEKICSFLISKDIEIEEKIRKLLTNTNESQVIVPFFYQEIKAISELYFYKNRISDFFYSRDLFSYESALKKDIYFFGRNDIVHKIVNRHRSGENAGLFGLRKSGKTSIIYAIQRVLKSNNEYSVFIDCQDPGFYKSSWNSALEYIIKEIIRQNHIKLKAIETTDFNEKNCSKSFEEYLIQIKRKIKNKSILIIFDEVERITFEISISDNWKNGEDFIHFWRTLRSKFQSNDNLFTYLIVSTNPKCVETPRIVNQENPIFAQIPYEYIPPFRVNQTRDMVQKLSLIMGLKFDDSIFSRLTDDFGGHPFLIRMVCSAINSLNKSSKKPIRIDKLTYEKGKDLFEKKYSKYIEMVISILKEQYPDEYYLLSELAIGNIESFKEFASLSHEYTNHLLGYNIIDSNNGEYFFSIEAIRNYIAEEKKYKRILKTNKEKLHEISERRNILEPKLRQIIRTQLFSKYGEIEAKNIVLRIFGEPRKTKYTGVSYNELFNSNITEIYFDDLRKIISKQWDVFEFILGRDKKRANEILTIINKYRYDAHAKELDDDLSFNLFRNAATQLENYINAFLG